MRSVSGKVLSSYPISLSKAAKIHSRFVCAETGASQAVSAYLRRASASFNELNHLHKELKSERQKHKKPKSEITEESPTRGFGAGLSQELSSRVGESERKKHKKNKRGEVVNFGDNEGEIGMGVEGKENLTRSVELLSQEPSHGVEDSEKKKQKKNKKNKEKGGVGNFVENQGEIKKGEGKKGIEEKRIKDEDGGLLGSGKKKNDRRHFGNFGDNGVEEEREGGGKMGNEERVEERKKKRKSEEVEEGGVDGLEERRSKKKKRRKIEEDN